MCPCLALWPPLYQFLLHSLFPIGFAQRRCWYFVWENSFRCRTISNNTRYLASLAPALEIPATPPGYWVAIRCPCTLLTFWWRCMLWLSDIPSCERAKLISLSGLSSFALYLLPWCFLLLPIFHSPYHFLQEHLPTLILSIYHLKLLSFLCFLLFLPFTPEWNLHEKGTLYFTVTTAHWYTEECLVHSRSSSIF